MGEELGWFSEQARALGVVLDPEQLARLARLTDLLVEASARVNLTGLRRREEIWVKHHLDSLAAAALVPPGEPGEAVDVGSGAGFPGLPLAVARPALKVFLVESVHRKAAFLEQAWRWMGLGNVQVLAERAEALAHRPAWRGRFGWAFIRAVGSLAVSVELCSPLVRPGGRVVVMKGPGVQPEWEAGLAHAGRGGLRLAERRELALPGALQRVLVVLERVGEAPESWPRRPGRLGRP